MFINLIHEMYFLLTLPLHLASWLIQTFIHILYSYANSWALSSLWLVPVQIMFKISYCMDFLAQISFLIHEIMEDKYNIYFDILSQPMDWWTVLSHKTYTIWFTASVKTL